MRQGEYKGQESPMEMHALLFPQAEENAVCLMKSALLALSKSGHAERASSYLHHALGATGFRELALLTSRFLDDVPSNSIS